MQEYDLPIVVAKQGSIRHARLKVIRLPRNWYAVVWMTVKRYTVFSQNKTEWNGGFDHLSDRDFLDRVQLVARFAEGIDFEFEEAVV